MKIHIAAMLTLFIAFCGCKQSDLKFGNLAGADGVDLVQDALAVMESAYPPAKTRLNMLAPVDDMFGVRLVESLRAGGWAVAEYVPPPKGFREAPPADPTDGLGFGYAVDRNKDWLRVTLFVGEETLGRLYRVQDDGDGGASYPPLGTWVRKERGARP